MISPRVIPRPPIRDFASFLEKRKGIEYMKISDYELVNDRIDY
jgi:hypothetical protein